MTTIHIMLAHGSGHGVSLCSSIFSQYLMEQQSVSLFELSTANQGFSRVRGLNIESIDFSIFEFNDSKNILDETIEKILQSNVQCTVLSIDISSLYNGVLGYLKEGFVDVMLEHHINPVFHFVVPYGDTIKLKNACENTDLIKDAEYTLWLNDIYDRCAHESQVDKCEFEIKLDKAKAYFTETINIPHLKDGQGYPAQTYGKVEKNTNMHAMKRKRLLNQRDMIWGVLKDQFEPSLLIRGHKKAVV